MRKTNLPEAGGLLLGWSRDRTQVYCNTEDSHSLIIGSTGSGKSRHLMIPSMALTALAGESIVATDIKRELYLYQCRCLERLGYEVITIDFIDPLRGNRYNFLQPVIDAVNMGDYAKAATWAQDISALLVPDKPNSNTDPLWSNGERAIITVAILVVCILFDDPRWQNLANARHFIAKMCVPGPKGEPAPIVDYLNRLPDDSPMRTALDIAQIAPEKMQCSFYASALTTLSLFADPNIHDMTAMTDFDHMATGDRKRAIFIILPDERSGYYPMASLFVFQQYQLLVQAAKDNGNRLNRRVEFFCDEFGNFVKIPDWDKAITVGRGYGCRFHMAVQDTGQIYAKYGQELGKTITSNCDTWVYLRTGNPDTVKELVEKLGKYTIKSPNVSSSSDGHGSAGFSYTGRELLSAEEIQRIERPWQLVIHKGKNAMMYAPDISKTVFNTMLGMGNKRHNQKLQQLRNLQRPTRSASVSYWDGYKQILGGKEK